MDDRPEITTAQTTQDEEEWQLADEELDRSTPTKGTSICSTSRPCSCSRCQCR